MPSSLPPIRLRLLLFTAALCVALVIGCSEERVPTTLPGAHPSAWTDPASVDFHGDVVLAGSAEGCTQCHGSDFDGGKVGISCVDCHLASGSACTACHGGIDNKTGAPPSGLRGEVDDGSLAVGAHTVHLEGAGLSDGIECRSCHNVPVFSLDPTHLGSPADSGAVDSIAEVVWHDFADGGGAAWDRMARTCANTYCHGRFAGGDTANTPVWTGADQAACGSCHDIGAAPATLRWKHEFHVTVGGLHCIECHAAVVDSQLNITGLGLHVNGVADTLIRDSLAVCAGCHGAGVDACTFCHGGTDNPTGAPPVGLRGETSTTELAVGAHTTHVSDGQTADAFDCNACHIKPVSLLDPGHLGADSTAEVTWGDIATAAGINWNRSNSTCTDTYCHGNFPGGNADNAPLWTASGQAACGSCHDVGADPALLLWIHDYHVRVASFDCAHCHADVVDTLLNITDIRLHVNGVADTRVPDSTMCNLCHGTRPQACVYCHGGTDNGSGAPPTGLRGQTAQNDIEVGAHTIHVEGGLQADAFDCSECHLTPARLSDAGHLGVDSVAEITWSGIAPAPGITWNRSSAMCTNTYCHGNFQGGDGTNSPIWTAIGQADCGSCHDVGSDPGRLAWKHAYHTNVAGLVCTDCHASVVDSALQIVDRALHVNGVVDTRTLDSSRCDACHGPAPQGCLYCHGGGDNQTGAPPKGLEGETLETQLAVGAHSAHVQPGTLADAFDCVECHQKPFTLADPGHLGLDSVAEVIWGGIASAPGIAWNRGAATCQDTYCHGNFRGGNGGNVPIWTAANQAGCGSCHDVGSDPERLGGRHQKHVEGENLPCERCHASTADLALTIVGPELHVNGQAEVVFSTGQGSFSNGTCSELGNGCHDPEEWN